MKFKDKLKQFIFFPLFLLFHNLYSTLVTSWQQNDITKGPRLIDDVIQMSTFELLLASYKGQRSKPL